MCRKVQKEIRFFFFENAKKGAFRMLPFITARYLFCFPDYSFLSTANLAEIMMHHAWLS